MFLGCVYARELWFLLLAPFGMVAHVLAQAEDIASWWIRHRMVIAASLRQTFDMILLLVCWVIWKERNSRTFDGVTLRARDLYAAFVGEAEAWTAAGYRTLGAALVLWSQSLSNM